LRLSVRQIEMIDSAMLVHTSVRRRAVDAQAGDGEHVLEAIPQLAAASGWVRSSSGASCLALTQPGRGVGVGERSPQAGVDGVPKPGREVDLDVLRLWIWHL
jgi:hypothetical protein